MKDFSQRQIRRTLQKYDMEQWDVDVTIGHRLQIVGVTDPYQLLDRMLEKEEQSVRFPYWAEVWPSSLALGRWILEVAGDDESDSDPTFGPPPNSGEVLELGCGLGLLGICLARAGWQVKATDFVEDALIFASHNAANNGSSGRFRVAYLDWRRPVGSPVRCIVGADLVYEKSNHRPLDNLLRQLLLPGGRFLLADPRRPAARYFCQILIEQDYRHSVQTREVRWKSTAHQVHIHVFDKPP